MIPFAKCSEECQKRHGGPCEYAVCVDGKFDTYYCPTVRNSHFGDALCKLEDEIDTLKEEKEELKSDYEKVCETNRNLIEFNRELKQYKPSDEVIKRLLDLTGSFEFTSTVEDLIELYDISIEKRHELEDELRQDNEIEEAENRALDARQQLSLQSADWASLERRNCELQGALSQAKETIDKLMEAVMR